MNKIKNFIIHSRFLLIILLLDSLNWINNKYLIINPLIFKNFHIVASLCLLIYILSNWMIIASEEDV